jgi:hypothetical protein
MLNTNVKHGHEQGHEQEHKHGHERKHEHEREREHEQVLVCFHSHRPWTSTYV